MQNVEKIFAKMNDREFFNRPLEFKLTQKYNGIHKEVNSLKPISNEKRELIIEAKKRGESEKT